VNRIEFTSPAGDLPPYSTRFGGEVPRAQAVRFADATVDIGILHESHHATDWEWLSLIPGQSRPR